MKPAPIAITEEHRKLFCEAVDKWQALLNLGDWRIHVSKTPGRTGVLAEVVKASLPDRQATIRIGRGWDENNQPTPESLEAVALHELGHIMLEELNAVVSNTNSTFDDRMAAEHRVINTLVRLHLGVS